MQIQIQNVCLNLPTPTILYIGFSYSVYLKYLSLPKGTPSGLFNGHIVFHHMDVFNPPMSMGILFAAIANTNHTAVNNLYSVFSPFSGVLLR